MNKWRLAESLKTLREQVDAMFPNRSKVSDGSIGDARHQANRSDHNPNQNGVVTAIDITHDPERGVDCHRLASALVASGDPRIKYVIWNGRITQKGNLSAWKKYTGSNPHNHHLHISVSSDAKLYDSSVKWDVGLSSFPSEKEVEKLFSQPVLKMGDKGEAVVFLQEALKRHNHLIEADGHFGPTTDRVLREFQKSMGLKVDGVAGVSTWQELLKG